MHEAAPIRILDATTPPDPTAFDSWIDRLTKDKLVDARDVIFTRNAAHLLAVVLPMTTLIFLAPPWLSFAIGVVYIPWLMKRWAGPYVLMVHAVTHRPLFKKRLRGLDAVITMGLAPFFGIPPTAYHPHHVLMHHKENNGPHDLSATYGYRRDRFVDFLHYWFRFAAFGHFHLASWLVRSENWSSLWRFVVGELLYLVALLGLLWLDPVAAAVVFVTPYVLLRFFLMAGNWAQHAFVDVDEPTNSYRNSTCLLNTRYNRRCYNDGYHIVHHRKPGLHWAEMPQAFLDDLPAYVRNDAIVFDGVTDNQQIWWRLMTGDYGFLADRLVDLGGPKRSRDEKIAFLQGRVQRVGEARRGLFERRERPPARTAARAAAH